MAGAEACEHDLSLPGAWAPNGGGKTCRACKNGRIRDRYRDDILFREAERARVQARWLRRKYDLSLEEYDQMLARQGGGCAICRSTIARGQGGRFQVDHDHSCCPDQFTCGECLRGLLCGNCNKALGLLGESVDVLKRAIAYLED